MIWPSLPNGLLRFGIAKPRKDRERGTHNDKPGFINSGVIHDEKKI